MLEVDKLRAGYGAINVLWDVSLSVPQGKLTTIIGPNGAGKTTLLRAIMGLVTEAQKLVVLVSGLWGILIYVGVDAISSFLEKEEESGSNVGGQFPLGEVFTEAQDLEAVNGTARIFVFGDTSFHVNQPATPVTVIIEQGRITGTENSTPEFDNMLAIIRAHEGEVWVRELGFGMNRAFSRTRMVDDIGTYERMCGIHLSLGAKHGVYAKPQFKRKDARYYVDVFAVTDAVYLDDQRVYADGAWVVAG